MRRISSASSDPDSSVLDRFGTLRSISSPLTRPERLLSIRWSYEETCSQTCPQQNGALRMRPFIALDRRWCDADRDLHDGGTVADQGERGVLSAGRVL